MPHEVGSLARIAEWDMPQLGVLQLTARGGQRFRILTRDTTAGGLQRAQVEWIPPDDAGPIPAPLESLVPLLQAVVQDAGSERIPEPHEFGDASWVGYRYCEILPIPNLARQKLLELEDSHQRLEIIFAYLAQRGLVK